MHGLASLLNPRDAHTDTVRVNVTVDDADTTPQFTVTPGAVDPADGSVTYTITATDDTTPPAQLMVRATDLAGDDDLVSPGHPVHAAVRRGIAGHDRVTYTPTPQQRIEAYNSEAVD